MGIELPAELTGVAAAAGVRWPRADEDAMRATAQAWRQAGTQTSTLAVDADHTAGRALSVVQGTAGTAATRHWQTFVAPDTGHLSRAAQGCLDAADRLDHAADQVGAAKVQIVRHLVTLAQHTDAANQAAAAGHPSALAGLPVAVRGTAVNVAQVNHTLTNSIALPTSPARGGGPLGHAGANPGPLSSTGLLAQPVVSTAASSLSSDGPLASQGPLSHGGGLGRTVDSVVGSAAQPASAAAGSLSSDGPLASQGPLSHGGGLGHTVDSTVGPVAQPPASTAAGDHIGPPVSAGPPVGGPALPISPDPTVGASQPVGHPPLPGAPSTPGVTVAQSAAPPVAPPPVAAAPPISTLPAQPAPIGPSQGDIWPAGPTPGPIAEPTPTFAGSAPAAGTGGPIAGLGPTGQTPAAGQSATAGQTPTAAPAPATGQAPATGRAPATGPAPTGGASPTAGPAPTPAGNGPTAAIGVTTAPPPRSGARSGARPVGAPMSVIAPTPVQTTEPRQNQLSIFLMYLFPDGREPADANRPVSRQLPPPPPDTDFAAGLRFPPHDHPESHRMTAQPRTEPTPPSPPQPAPTELTDGYDPLGYENQNEHDWDRRFLVRPGTPAEYAWPPAEPFPEGGCTDAEPVLLEPGTILDRFGTPEGRVFGDGGAPYQARSLPPDHLDAGYRRYRVTRELPVWRTVSAPWFGQPGGGVRLRSVYPAADLVAFGYLAEETHGQ